MSLSRRGFIINTSAIITAVAMGDMDALAQEVKVPFRPDPDNQNRWSAERLTNLDPILKAELQTQFDLNRIPTDPVKRLQIIRAFTVIEGQYSRYIEAIEAVAGVKQREDIAEGYISEAVELACGTKDLDPEILADMCASIRRTEDFIDIIRKTGSDVDDFFFRADRAFEYKQDPTGNPVLKRVFRPIQVVVKGAGALNAYLNDKAVEHVRDNRDAQQNIRDVLETSTRVLNVMRAEAQSNLPAENEAPANRQEEAALTLDSIIRDPFQQPEGLEETGFEPQDITPEDIESLPPEAKETLDKLSDLPKDDDEALQAAMIEIAQSMGQIGKELGAQRAVIALLLEREQERIDAENKLKEAQAEERIAYAIINIGAMYIGEILGKPKAAKIFEGLSTRFYQAYKAQEAYNSMSEEEAASKAGTAAALTAGQMWVALAIFAYKAYEEQKEEQQQDPIIQMMIGLSEQLSEVHADLAKNIHIVQQQNITIIKLLVEGFEDLKTQGRINEAKIEQVKVMLKASYKEALEMDRDRLLEDFAAQETIVEAVYDSTTNRAANDNEIGQLNQVLAHVSDHALVAAYNTVFSASPDELLTPREVRARVDARPEHPAFLTGLLPSILSNLGVAAPNVRIPNPVEWSRGVDAFALTKAANGDVDTAYDNRLRRIFNEGKDITLAVNESLTLETLEGAKEAYVRSAMVFAVATGRALDAAYQPHISDRHSRRHAQPIFTHLGNQFYEQGLDFFINYAEGLGVIKKEPDWPYYEGPARAPGRRPLGTPSYFYEITFEATKFTHSTITGLSIGTSEPTHTTDHRGNPLVETRFVQKEPLSELPLGLRRFNRENSEFQIYGEPIEFDNVAVPNFEEGPNLSPETIAVLNAELEELNAGLKTEESQELDAVLSPTLKTADFRLETSADVARFIANAIDLHLIKLRNRCLIEANLQMIEKDEQAYNQLLDAKVAFEALMAFHIYKSGAEFKWPKLSDPESILGNLYKTVNSSAFRESGRLSNIETGISYMKDHEEAVENGDRAPEEKPSSFYEGLYRSQEALKVADQIHSLSIAAKNTPERTFADYLLESGDASTYVMFEGVSNVSESWISYLELLDLNARTSFLPINSAMFTVQGVAGMRGIELNT